VPTFQIHEVFYDNHYDVIGYEKTPAIAFGDIQDELYENFCDMMKAFDEVPLNLDHIDYLMKVKDDERKSNSN
jgi:hypothetical protein